MKVVDLIIELSKLNPDLEVVYDATEDGEDQFRFVVVESLGEISTNIGDSYALLNIEALTAVDEEDEDE